MLVNGVTPTLVSLSKAWLQADWGRPGLWLPPRVVWVLGAGLPQRCWCLSAVWSAAGSGSPMVIHVQVWHYFCSLGRHVIPYRSIAPRIRAYPLAAIISWEALPVCLIGCLHLRKIYKVQLVKTWCWRLLQGSHSLTHWMSDITW